MDPFASGDTVTLKLCRRLIPTILFHTTDRQLHRFARQHQDRDVHNPILLRAGQYVPFRHEDRHPVSVAQPLLLCLGRPQ